jgi:hypothetical protein
VATLATQTISVLGIVPAYSAAAGGGDAFTPTERTYLHVKNGGGSPITVTIVTPGEAAPNISIADVAVSVSNGSEQIIGPFPAGLFQSASTGLASITYSGVTSVTVGCFRLGT